MGDDAWGEGEWLVVALHANRVMTYINVINNIILKNFPLQPADCLCFYEAGWFQIRLYRIYYFGEPALKPHLPLSLE